MKTFTQLSEDIAKRRQELRQRQLDQMSTHKKRVASYQAAQKERQQASAERDQLKKEIKKELQTEQITEGKKNQLVRAYLAGRQQSEPTIVDYGDSAPNSEERASQIAAMMRDSGGGAVRRAIKQREKQAKKAVKRILKHQVTEVTLGAGETYGSPSYQERLKKERTERKQEKETQRQQDTNAARRAFRTTGMRVTHRGQPGVIRDGEFIPDT